MKPTAFDVDDDFFSKLKDAVAGAFDDIANRPMTVEEAIGRKREIMNKLWEAEQAEMRQEQAIRRLRELLAAKPAPFGL